MIQSNLLLSLLKGGSSVRAKLVKIPILLLFILSIVSQSIMQLKTAMQYKRVLDFPDNPEMAKVNVINASGAIRKRQLQQKAKQMFSNEINGTIAESRIIESDKNSSEANKTVQRSGILTGESNELEDHIQQPQQKSDSNRKDLQNSQNVSNVTTLMNNIILPITPNATQPGDHIQEPQQKIDFNKKDLHSLLNDIIPPIKEFPNAKNLGDIVYEIQYRRDSNAKELQKFRNKQKVTTTLLDTTHLRKPKIKTTTKVDRKTRVIYGIMTYDSKSERQRRGLIRSTFLSYFKNYMNRTLVTEEEYNEKRDWICSLNDLDHGRLRSPEKCRMAYAFVQGANPNGTQMLLSFNESYPLSLPPPEAKSLSQAKDATDTVYLNIQENGKYGKSPTWFRYAIDVLHRHDWMEDWDYIYKTDTDNLLYTPLFFRFMDKRLPKKRRAKRVYGGRPLTYKTCGGDNHDHCKQMVGPYFMQGGSYFLSTDLAKFISDETTFDHDAVKLPHEDMTTGNFVYSHPEKIRVIKESKIENVVRKHPVKKDRAWKFRWGKMLRQEQERLTNWTAKTLMEEQEHLANLTSTNTSSLQRNESALQ